MAKYVVCYGLNNNTMKTVVKNNFTDAWNFYQARVNIDNLLYLTQLTDVSIHPTSNGDSGTRFQGD